MTPTTLRQYLFPTIIAAGLIGLNPALAADAKDAKEGPTVDLSAEASVKAPNDFAQATLYFEASDKDPAALSKKVNRVIADAIEQAKGQTAVQTSTSGVNTYPVHSKDGQRIEAWRMRSSLQLESRDIPALSELLGKLQETLALSGLVTRPAPETRNSAADKAAIEAIRAFEARAKSVADSLGKQYRLRHLAVNYGGGQPPGYPMMRSAAFAADSISAPIEGGESEIAVSVNGTIELLD